MSGFCAAVDTAACASRISNLSKSGFMMNLMPMLAVLCACSVLPIDIRYQVSGVRYCSYSQHLGLLTVVTACSNDIIISCCDNARTVCILYSQRFGRILQGDVYCDAAVVLLLVLRLHSSSSSSSNQPKQQRRQLLLLLLLLLLFLLLCCCWWWWRCCYRFRVKGRSHLSCTSTVGNRYNSP